MTGVSKVDDTGNVTRHFRVSSLRGILLLLTCAFSMGEVINANPRRVFQRSFGETSFLGGIGLGKWGEL